jgi:hypothetical protein
MEIGPVAEKIIEGGEQKQGNKIPVGIKISLVR